MSVVRYIGEQFYIDYHLLVDNVMQDISNYQQLDILIIGESGELRYTWPDDNNIIQLDNYTYRIYLSSTDTHTLGVGNVRIELRLMTNTNPITITIVTGDLFKLKDAKIAHYE